MQKCIPKKRDIQIHNVIVAVDGPSPSQIANDCQLYVHFVFSLLEVH
jgi:hypothetical protein